MPPAASSDEATLLAAAVRCLQQGDAGGATQHCRRVLQAFPASADAHAILGVIAARAGDFAAAVASFSASLDLNPRQPAMQNNCGVALRRLDRHEEAAARFRAAIALAPGYAEAHFNLANLLRDRGAAQQALASYEQALALQPTFAAGYNGRGAALADLQRPQEALGCFDTAVALQPGFTEAMANRSQALLALGRVEEALAAADQALTWQPAHAPALVHRGNALARLRRFADAVRSHEAALALDPGDATAHANRGAVLLEANRFEEAIASLDQALALRPDDPVTLENRAQAATRARRFDQAAADYERLLAVAPDHPAALGNLLHARMLVCDWRDFDALADGVRAGIASGAFVAEPFGWQAVAQDEAELRRCAEIYSAREYPADGTASPARPGPDGRPTIGYVCGEFREHATTILMCGVFERHDSRWCRIAFDNGGSDHSGLRARVEAAFDEVVDIRGLSDREAADRVRGLGVDILVNLNGYYGEGRMGLFALRPCAIQVNYLGFPGTLGAPYFDYLIADRTVVPEASRLHYVEEVVWLPDSYQANDDRRAVAEEPQRRADHGLPDDAFVFCCFNNNYKITPATFAAWMRILQEVPGSVLWLLEDNAWAARNLRQAARSHGTDADRLVFAPRLPPARHLARHALADLFLDTLPYNAHTTASDALWAGLPVLTQRGTTFPGRVGASLLLAAGLPELVTESAAEFESRAVTLARDPGWLQALRHRLRSAGRSSPLFDTARFTANLEAAFETLLVRRRNALPAGS